MATNHNPEKGPRTLSCEAWEAMLVDALDGTLEARDAEAFTAHSKECAGCGELLEEAKRGTEWLRFLRATPEAPQGLLEKILAGTSGLPQVQPLEAAGGAVALPTQHWMGASMAAVQRHVVESRMLMTIAMAFFSIALTLNLTGVRLNQLKLSDLRPSTLASSLSHEYFTTSAHVMRYYSNLRFVYEVESRLNEMRRDTSDRPAGQPESQPQTQKPATKSASPSATPAGGKPGGSARKSDSTDQAEPQQSSYEAPASVLASCRSHSNAPFALSPRLQVWAQGGRSKGPSRFYPYPGNHHKPSERSLV